MPCVLCRGATIVVINRSGVYLSTRARSQGTFPNVAAVHRARRLTSPAAAASPVFSSAWRIVSSRSVVCCTPDRVATSRRGYHRARSCVIIAIAAAAIIILPIPTRYIIITLRYLEKKKKKKTPDRDLRLGPIHGPRIT